MAVAAAAAGAKAAFNSQGVAAAGMSSGGNILSGLLSEAFAKRHAKLQYKYNKKLMDKQNDFTIWQQLNGQSLDKQGLKNAGISTATMQGPMPLAGSAQGSIGMPQSQGFGSLGSDAVAAMQNERLSLAQERLINAQAKGQEIENGYKPQIIQSTIDTMKATIDNLKSQGKLSDKQAQKLEQDWRHEEAFFKHKLQNFKLTNEQLQQGIRGMIQQNDFNLEMYPLQLKSAMASIYQMYASGALSHAQAAVAKGQVALLAEETNKLVAENKYNPDLFFYRMQDAKFGASIHGIDLNYRKSTYHWDVDNARINHQNTYNNRTTKFDYYMREINTGINVARNGVGLASDVVGVVNPTYGAVKNVTTMGSKNGVPYHSQTSYSY